MSYIFFHSFWSWLSTTESLRPPFCSWDCGGSYYQYSVPLENSCEIAQHRSFSMVLPKCSLKTPETIWWGHISFAIPDTGTELWLILQDCNAQFPTHLYQGCHSSFSDTSIWLTVPFLCLNSDKSSKPVLQVLCYPIKENSLFCGVFVTSIGFVLICWLLGHLGKRKRIRLLRVFLEGNCHSFVFLFCSRKIIRHFWPPTRITMWFITWSCCARDIVLILQEVQAAKHFKTSAVF